MERETKDCPFCGEEILAVAKKCKHCGEFLDEELRSSPKNMGIGPEEELWRGNPSVLYYLAHWLLGAILVVLGAVFASTAPFFIVLLVLGLWVIIYSILDQKMKVFTVTTYRVVAKTGIVSRKTSEISIGDIRSVAMDQKVLERLFRLGTVGIGSAGTAGTEVSFVGVHNPTAVRDLVRRTKDGTDR